MKINKFNKKVINNLIVGSFLFGSSASIITQIQATQRPQRSPQKEKYEPCATDKLESGLYDRNLSMEDCIRLIRDKNADPNTQAKFRLGFPDNTQRYSLTPLEEAILSRHPDAMETFIRAGADVSRVSEEIKRKFGPEVTLLHLALLTPDEMKALDEIRSVDRAVKTTQPRPLFGPNAKIPLPDLSAENSRTLTLAHGTPIPIPPPRPYVPREIVNLLLDKGLKFELNAKDKDGKTALDWALERRLILMLKLQNPQKPEIDCKMEGEYKNVIEWLFTKDAKYNESNQTMYSYITRWEVKIPTNLQKPNLRPSLRDDLLQKLRQWQQNLKKH